VIGKRGGADVVQVARQVAPGAFVRLAGQPQRVQRQLAGEAGELAQLVQRVEDGAAEVDEGAAPAAPVALGAAWW
jgi:cell division protein FtsB